VWQLKTAAQHFFWSHVRPRSSAA